MSRTTSRAGAGLTPKTLAIGVTSSCGKQNDSTRETTPFYGMGTGTREIFAKRYLSNEHVKKDSTPPTPGPGAYNHSAAIPQHISSGKQSESRIRSSSSWGFGSQKRFDTSVRDRIQMTPGPGAYTP